MGFDMQNAWRVSDINSNYKYDPQTLVLSFKIVFCVNSLCIAMIDF